MYEHENYKEDMQFPVANLAIAMYGKQAVVCSDVDIVEAAARKINMLKRMILATGFNEAMLAAIMEE